MDHDLEKRKIGEQNFNAKLPELINQVKSGAGFKEVLLRVHELSYTESIDPVGRGTRKLLGGRTRDQGYDVIIHSDITGGEIVPPPGTVNFELTNLFCEKLSNLKNNCKTQDDFDSLACYAYLNLILLHPFEDGNGRTCRNIMGLISALGNEGSVPNLKFPHETNGNKALNSQIEEEVKIWVNNINLFPKSENDLSISPSLLSYMQNEAGYTDKIKNNFKNLWKIQTIEGIKNIRVVKSIKDKSQNTLHTSCSNKL